MSSSSAPKLPWEKQRPSYWQWGHIVRHQESLLKPSLRLASSVYGWVSNHLEILKNYLHTFFILLLFSLYSNEPLKQTIWFVYIRHSGSFRIRQGIGEEKKSYEATKDGLIVKRFQYLNYDLFYEFGTCQRYWANTSGDWGGGTTQGVSTWAHTPKAMPKAGCGHTHAWNQAYGVGTDRTHWNFRVTLSQRTRWAVKEQDTLMTPSGLCLYIQAHVCSHLFTMYSTHLVYSYT